MTSNLVFSAADAPIFKIYVSGTGFFRNAFVEAKNCKLEELVLKTNDANTARLTFLINRNNALFLKNTAEIVQPEEQFELVADTALMITRQFDSSTENIVFAGIVKSINYEIAEFSVVDNNLTPTCFIGHADCIGIESFLQEIKLFSYFCYDPIAEDVFEVNEKTIFANNYNSLSNSFGGSEPWTLEKLLSYLNFFYKPFYKGAILAETSLLGQEISNLQADNIWDLIRELLSYGALFRTIYYFDESDILTFKVLLTNVMNKIAQNYSFPCRLNVSKSSRYNGIVISWNSPFYSSNIVNFQLQLTAPWQSDYGLLNSYKTQIAITSSRTITYKDLYTQQRITTTTSLATPREGDVLSQQNILVPDFYLHDYPIFNNVQVVNIYGGSFLINLYDFKFDIESVTLPLRIFRTSYATIPVTFVNNSKAPIPWWCPETEISIQNGVFRVESEIRHAFAPLNLAAGPGYFNSTFWQPMFFIDLSLPVYVNAKIYSENASFKYTNTWLQSANFNKTLFVDLGNLPAFPPPNLCSFFDSILAVFFAGTRNSATVTSILDTPLNEIWGNFCVDSINNVELNTFATNYVCRFDEAAGTYVFELQLDIFDEQFFINAIKKRLAMNNLESYVNFSEQSLRIQSSMNDSFPATVTGQSDDFFNTCIMTDLGIPIYLFVLKPTALQTTEYLNNTNRQYTRINSYTRRDLTANETQVIVPSYSLDNFIRVKINDEDLCYNSETQRWHTLIDENEQNARAWARRNTQ